MFIVKRKAKKKGRGGPRGRLSSILSEAKKEKGLVRPSSNQEKKMLTDNINMPLIALPQGPKKNAKKRKRGRDDRSTSALVRVLLKKRRGQRKGEQTPSQKKKNLVRRKGVLSLARHASSAQPNRKGEEGRANMTASIVALSHGEGGGEVVARFIFEHLQKKQTVFPTKKGKRVASMLAAPRKKPRLMRERKKSITRTASGHRKENGKTAAPTLCPHV